MVALGTVGLASAMGSRGDVPSLALIETPVWRDGGQLREMEEMRRVEMSEKDDAGDDASLALHKMPLGRGGG